MSNTTNIVEPAEAWEPTNKTVNVRKSTWKRLQKYYTKYGDTFDSIINDLMNEGISKT